MSKELSYEGKMKQERGKIDLDHPENYIPWILARECKGDGTRHMIPDLYHKNRTIHLMSDLEKDVYYTLRSKENVLEVFEQYPLLPISRTEEICDKYDIIHPKNPITKKKIVLTTDFLLIIKDKDGMKKWMAYAVKPTSMMKNHRTREKLYIEKKYWEALDVDWKVITEEQINKVFVNNVILCRTGYSSDGVGSIYDTAKFLIVNNLIEVDMHTKQLDLDNLICEIERGEYNYGTRLYNEK